jgi:hypothetical protein
VTFPYVAIMSLDHVYPLLLFLSPLPPLLFFIFFYNALMGFIMTFSYVQTMCLDHISCPLFYDQDSVYERKRDVYLSQSG